ncbi:MAG: tRNA-splicing endonuclease subunit sen34 [Trebouxia sp. A1-2]|nr:MAG: tRNA-splicing endonuclease subunit sen34 [Trebouxia sp. A1-2]
MPISATVVGDRGYVWDAEGATWLRRHCRVVGAMSGNSAEHKQHNSAGGLPCELNPEELQLALCQGWVVIRTTASLPEPTANAAAPSTGLSTEHIQPKVHVPAWLTAVQSKKAVMLPVTASQLNPAVLGSPGSNSPHRRDPAVTTVHCAQHNAADTVHACTKHAMQNDQPIFSKLHSMGYYITDGAKFGADYLLYPGDPLLFHAQFTVRILEHDTPIKPALLAGSARGSHAARKHLLLASVDGATASFITVAPEGGFGSTG